MVEWMLNAFKCPHGFVENYKDCVYQDRDECAKCKCGQNIAVEKLYLGILNEKYGMNVTPVVHARWQGVSPFVDSRECSNCHYCIQSEELETPYCPWCGAKMDDGGE